MRTAIATLKSASPYSQSKYIDEPRGPKETAKDHEERVWRERLHANKDGYVIIEPMCFQRCIAEVAKYLSIQIPGKGKSTYTKHFDAGVMVTEPLVLPVKKNDVPGEWLHVPSDGRKGGPKRVLKCFPVIHEWEGSVTFHILDDTITPEVFEQHLREAGVFIGIGRFRPRNGGYYGRFKPTKVVWS